MNKNVVLVIFYLFLSTAFVYPQNSLQTILDDMTLPPDAPLHGVPIDFSWSKGQANAQNTVPAKNNRNEWFRALTSWGQVYLPVNGSRAVNTRCQIRHVLTKILNKNGQWIEVQSNDPSGAAFFEDFEGNLSIDAGIRDETDNGGGKSIVVGVGLWSGRNFHFWPNESRATIHVDSIVGVFSSCEARLIVDNPTLPDDRDSCKNLLQMGADWWLDTSIRWLPDLSASAGIGNARSKWISKEWQYFNYCTLSPLRILQNPPINVSVTFDAKPFESPIYFYFNAKTNILSLYLKSTSSSNNVVMSIYDIHGRIQMNKPLHHLVEEVDISYLPDGFYVVKVTVNGRSCLYKALKHSC